MVHYFHSNIAQRHGVNAAVLAGFIRDCIEEKGTRQPQLHEGKVWFRCSVQMLTGSFPYLSYDEIRYVNVIFSIELIKTQDENDLEEFESDL